jgi:hypothetical protein
MSAAFCLGFNCEIILGYFGFVIIVMKNDELPSSWHNANASGNCSEVYA